MKKPFIIFYCLIIYALAELIWWGILLVYAEPRRIAMIVGEGAVFFFIFLIGVFQLHKTLRKEFNLHLQQQNFLLSVTHELKSPLASIKLCLQTIVKRNLEHTQQQSFIENSLKDVERLGDLVENMLIATKIENNSYSFPKEKFNLSDLIKKVANRLEEQLCQTQMIEISIENDIYLKGDPFVLSLAASNLIENAIKYTGPAGSITIKLYEKNAGIYFEVADQSFGIADHEKSAVFNKFYRVGNEHTRKTNGTGLGLYIVKQIVEKHQAKITIRDNKPRGTIFEILFKDHAQ